MQTMAIIGGGFSGTMAAVNLARLSTNALDILLINHQHPLARSVAYGTRQGEHLLNKIASITRHDNGCYVRARTQQ